MSADRLYSVWLQAIAPQADQTPHEYACSENSAQVTVAKEYWPAGARLLYLGCGSGREVHEARRAGFDATGVTYGIADVAFAQEHFNLQIHRMDMHLLPEDWAGSFDGVLAFQTLEHTPSPILLLAEVYRVLKRGGRFYSETPGPGMEDAKPYHLTCPIPIQLKGWMMKIGFTDIEVGDFPDGDGNRLDPLNPPAFTWARFCWGTGIKP